MERAEGLLGGKFLFKRQNEQSKKLKLYVAFLASEFSYHLNAKHPKESSPRLDGRQPTLHNFSRKITRPVHEKVTIWDASDCRPINIVEESGLIEVIQIASGEILTIYRRGAPLCLADIPCMCGGRETCRRLVGVILYSAEGN